MFYIKDSQVSLALHSWFFLWDDENLSTLVNKKNDPKVFLLFKNN